MRVVLLLLVAVLPLLSQDSPKEEKVDEAWIKANYTKYEHRIAMRDGKRLFTAVYVPKDRTKRYPMLMSRTPYSVSPYGVDQHKKSLGPSDHFARAGYIIVYQDVRGRYMSEGDFVNVRPYQGQKNSDQIIDESSDTYDTIDWLVKNVPNNNGRVGLWGISYPGFYAAAGAVDAHPALKAVSPQAPVTDWFLGDDFHHNGAFFLPHAFRFLAQFGKPRPEPKSKPDEPFDFPTRDGYKFYLETGPLYNFDEKYLKGEVGFWRELMQNPNYSEYWQTRALQRSLNKIKPAVMTVGGWFDAEDVFGPLKVYETIERTSPGAENMLVMGPWYHGQWGGEAGEHLGQARFNSKTGEFYREQIQFPFFEKHLNGKESFELPEAFVFETGRNLWRRLEAWPPKQAAKETLYFGESGALALEQPAASGKAYDEYISDPDKPVPYIPGIALNMTREYMVDDQRFASTRPDVLVYQMPVLEEDFTIAGNIDVVLYASTSGTDSDFIVKLIDVYPDEYPNPDPNPENVEMSGYQQLIRGEPFRGRFRNSFEKPEAFRPNEVSKIQFTMPAVYHTFRRGHRVMVQVQSTWFPLIDRNPQKFVDIYKAKREDFQKATQRIYRGGGQASHLEVLVLEKEPSEVKK